MTLSPPSGTAGGPCGLRLLKKIALALAILASLLLCAAFLESWRGSRKWHHYKKELESQGENLDLKACQPPPLPADKNFALHPLIAALFATNSQPHSAENASFPQAALEDAEHDKSAQGPARKRSDFRTNLKRWSDYYRGHGKFPQAPPDASPAEVVRAALSLYDPQINELLKAMEERPLCRYPLDYEHGAFLFLPHLSRYKGLILTLQLRATADLHLGQPDKAFRELRLGCFINDTLAQDPLLISLLVQIAHDNLLWEAMREGVCLRRWRDEHLAWWVDYLSRRPYLAAFQRAMRAERNFAIFTMQQLLRGQIQETLGSDPGLVGTVFLRALPRGIWDHSLYYVVKMHHDYTIPAADPEHRTVDKDQALALEHALQNMGRSPYTIFARMTLPAVSRTIIHAARWQTLGDATLIACALERHRLATGRWPDHLSALVPKYLPFEPKDVLDQQPFVYKRTEPDTCRIYTFGWDERDDRGQPDNRLERGDWGIEIGPVDESSRR